MPAGVYTGGGATVIMDPPPLVYTKAFGIGTGPDRFTRGMAREVAITAMEIAPFKSGRLKRSIRVGQNRDEKGFFSFGFKVYTTVPYAEHVHEGTGPSVRYGHRKRMKFLGTNEYAGGYVFPAIVHHPGTPSQPFLRNALVAMVH